MSVAKARAWAAAPSALGIDLRSGPRYRTGVAVLDRDRRLRLLRAVRTDEEIAGLAAAARPAIIAIDAPLALPEGRCCADPGCPCAVHGILREVDRRCLALGYRPFPTLLPSMVRLTLRGMALAARLGGLAPVIEVYPGMAQDILGVPRTRSGTAPFARGLRRWGLRGLPRARRVTHDELDAATCALVGVLHLERATAAITTAGAPPFVYPRLSARGVRRPA